MAVLGFPIPPFLFAKIFDMKVVITYYDNNSLTKEEIIRQAKHNYGEYVDVSVYPISDDPWDMISFALQRLITYDQIGLYFNSQHNYEEKLSELEESIKEKLSKELKHVLVDNENKLT